VLYHYLPFITPLDPAILLNTTALLGVEGVLAVTFSRPLHKMTQAKHPFVLVASTATSSPRRCFAVSIIRGKFAQVTHLPGRRTMGCGTLRPRAYLRRWKMDTIWVLGGAWPLRIRPDLGRGSGQLSF